MSTVYLYSTSLLVVFNISLKRFRNMPKYIPSISIVFMISNSIKDSSTKKQKKLNNKEYDYAAAKNTNYELFASSFQSFWMYSTTKGERMTSAWETPRVSHLLEFLASAAEEWPLLSLMGSYSSYFLSISLFFLIFITQFNASFINH